MKRARPIRTIVTTIILTLGVVWLALNLTLGDKQFEERFVRQYDVHDRQFLRTMGVILGPPQVQGNDITALMNGDAIFPAMLQAIRSARHTINFETYIFWSGTVGQHFVDALSERAAAGVNVHVLLDWVGGNLDPGVLEELRAAGVHVRRYNAPHWYNLHFLNHRTHRKLLVVDGAIGFIGGVGIGEKWRGNGDVAGEWRDTHFQVRGPVVGQLQAAFVDNWMFASGEVLYGSRYFPDLEPVGTQLAQVFTSSPGGGRNSMQLMYLLSLTAATRNIRISAAYFVPDDASVQTLLAALKRGVRVQIVVPGEQIDWKFVRRASRALWGDLLEAGAEIYEYQPSMYHVKVLIIDDFLVSTGSTNFDNRSFSINDEANLNVYDQDFALRQIDVFDEDIRRSSRVTLEAWRERPIHDKVLDYLASLASGQL
ncbi:phospholipase D-like domain-containing protein [Noviherbaspirillum sp. CPCC 100848]|uniref:Phospholipase D-like domain-containing protein n=1 Tax=Noviherbaspirillum album TaxID=3080276 RepID=A0ABU6J396_9BURK|nr:phospholipase D-like domain-containing protein [Noviherbaspirillum sp. CPCC 100848]MEC4717689.1 phospholipase D-like domain-containing protein [Noviherbaspirillum sp. CPCC 100848]